MSGLDLSRLSPQAFVVLAMVAYMFGLSPWLAEYMLSGAVPPALEWNLTHYHVDYFQFGFLRRALVGTILLPIFSVFPDGGLAEYAILLGADAAIALVLAVLVARIFLRPHITNPNKRLIALICLIAPVGFVQLGYDAGRLDHVNFLLFVAAMRLVVLGQVLGAAFLSVAMLLVHEAALFYALPVVVAFAHASTKSVASVLVIGVPAVLCASALALWGTAGADLAPALPENANIAAGVWSRNLLEPARGFGPLHYIITLYLTFAALVFLRRHYKANAQAPDLLFAAPFAVLALFALGVDYGRWTHVLFVSVLAVIACAPHLGRKAEVELTPVSIKLFLLPWMLPLGPVGIALLYPFLPFIS